MAKAGYALIVAAILAAALPCLTAQSPAPAPLMLPMSPASPGPGMDMAPSPGLDCFTYLLNLSDCLTFVDSASNLTKPDAGCCSELANLVNTQPICLCQLLGNPAQVGLNVDVNRALKLPGVCNVTTPPVSLCAAIGYPVGALTPSQGPSPSDGGSIAASPSPINGDMNGNGNSSSTSLFASKHHFLMGLVLLTFTFFF